MLTNLINFFKAFFSKLFGGNSSTPPSSSIPETTGTTTTFPSPESTGSTSTEVEVNPPTPPPVQVEDTPIEMEDLPTVENEFPQDGSEIDQDTSSTVVVVSENTPEVFDPKDPIFIDPVEETGTAAEAGPGSTSLPDEDDSETATASETMNPHTKHVARYMWCLDNGHGKLTAGKRSPKFADGRRFFEYEFNRDIVHRIAAKLDEIGVQYVNIVPEVEVDNALQMRVARANSFKSDLPKIYLSIHSNAAPAKNMNSWGADSVSGIETWYYHGNSIGKKIASIFQKQLIDATGWKNRHIKSQKKGQFYVLKHTNMTAVLTENGFYNNKKECAELKKGSVRQKIANAHVAAILEIESVERWVEG